jgi:hypothetical protein
VPNARLARRIRKDCRVEERRERTLDRSRPSVRKSLKQCNQHPRRIEQLISIETAFAASERL